MNWSHGQARCHWREEQALERKFILILTLQFLLLALLPQNSAAQPGPDNQLQVLLRTANGAPVAGVTVTLAPGPADLGGPANEVLARSGLTNAGGWIAFERVPQGIWLLSFAGSAMGLPLLTIALQGRPPYGTTTDGGGFTVAVNSARGDDIKLEDAPSSGVQQAIFTGRARDGVWVPEYDLSDPNMTPAPLSLLRVSVVPSPAPPRPNADSVVADTMEYSASASATQLSPLLLCYMPGLLTGLGLFGCSIVLRRRAAEGRG